MSAVNLPESSVFHDIIQGIGPGDLASPGVGAPPNRAAQMLADRTRYLHNQLKPTSTVILRQGTPQSIPAYAWTNMVYDVVHNSELADALHVPLEHIIVPAGFSEVQVQAGVALNEATATKRVAVALASLIDDQFPINAGYDAFHRYSFNLYPMASFKSGWIPVAPGARVSVGVMTNVSSLTGPGSTLSAEIILR